MTYTPPKPSGRFTCFTFLMAGLLLLLAIGLTLMALGMLFGQPPLPPLPLLAT